MKTRLTKIVLTFSILIMVACGQTSTKNDPTSELKNPIGSGKLISIDFADSNFVDLQSYTKDTITTDGWTIKYFVKDDSTKYNDIYIEWTKGGAKGLFCGGDLLQMRRYFVPEFVAETNTHLFFTHGCATDCSAILALSKDSTPKYIDYQNVVDYNLSLGQILYVTDRSYENEDEIYDLSLADLSKNKEHSIKFDNICGAVYKPSCIDTVIFTKNKVTIKTNLRESINTEKEIKQTKTIIL